MICFRSVRPPNEWSAAEILHHLEIVENRIADRVAQGVALARQNGWGPDADDADVVHSVDRFQIERVITPIQTRNPPEAGHSRDDLFTDCERPVKSSWASFAVPRT